MTRTLGSETTPWVVPDGVFEWVDAVPAAPVFLTCEHASQSLPEPFCWPDADRRLVDTHWAYDLGARDLTLELAHGLSAGAVLTRFSRLLIDTNRPETSPDLLRTVAEGAQVLLNQRVAPGERERRIALYYRPFHAAVDRALSQCEAETLLSVHSFAPVYEGSERTVEIGVLFNREEQAARALGAFLARSFQGVAYNEPWSGRDGLIYSAERHGDRHGRCALEIEVRQDLATSPAYRARLVQALVHYFRCRAESKLP